MKINKPVLEHVFDMTVKLDPIRELGSGRAGIRRIIPIVGGTVSGKKIKGKILNVGADWQTVFADGLAELDTRYAMETHDGATIEIINYGFRHGAADIMTSVAKGENVSPENYYMRTQARLETGDKRYDWINKTLFIGTGGRFKDSVEMAMYAVM